ncbi:MAG: DUF1847 domain-containing protein [Bacteroidales bacterium]|nr:DUF1847 domain-containing protein [Bacteroidales bacterium]
MNCVKCNTKNCRKNIACSAQKFDSELVLQEYHTPENQEIIQAAAKLVDNGKAGTLSRFDEIVQFAHEMHFEKIGLAYCYGMEAKVAVIFDKLKTAGLNPVAVSCTTGAMSQCIVNKESTIKSVSCNPISQAKQLNLETIDFAITIGLCLGHDLLFQKYIKAPFTTFVVKDRVFANNPLEIVNQ